jgi:magnesium transporter
MRWVHPEIIPLFRDVDDALAEIVERGRTLHHLLNNALTASRTEASIRQNEDTRKISAWAALLVAPTVVAGIFGMNLGGIPGSDHELGFATVTALTLLGSVLLYRQFKRTDWL